MWHGEWTDRGRDKILTLFRNDEPKGTIEVKGKDEEVLWQRALKFLVLNDPGQREVT